MLFISSNGFFDWVICLPMTIKLAPKLSRDTIIIVNSCGDAHKDRDILKQRLGKIWWLYLQLA